MSSLTTYREMSYQMCLCLRMIQKSSDKYQIMKLFNQIWINSLIGAKPGY